LLYTFEEFGTGVFCPSKKTFGEIVGCALVLRAVCSLHNSRRFLLPNAWVNSPPRVMKITVLHESTSDGLTVDGAFFHFGVLPRRWTFQGRFELSAVPRCRVAERVALHRRDRRPGGPQRVRARAVYPARPSCRVGFHPRDHGFVVGP